MIYFGEFDADLDDGKLQKKLLERGYVGRLRPHLNSYYWASGKRSKIRPISALMENVSQTKLPVHRADREKCAHNRISRGRRSAAERSGISTVGLREKLAWGPLACFNLKRFAFSLTHPFHAERSG